MSLIEPTRREKILSSFRRRELKENRLTRFVAAIFCSFISTIFMVVLTHGMALQGHRYEVAAKVFGFAPLAHGEMTLGEAVSTGRIYGIAAISFILSYLIIYLLDKQRDQTSGLIE